MARQTKTEDPTSMLTDKTPRLLAIAETETPSDRAMLVLQYLTAGIAVAAALLLAFVR